MMKTLYALYSPKQQTLMGVEVSSNGDAEFCNENTVRLSGNNNQIWTTDSHEQAEIVATEEIGWFSSSISRPMYRERIYYGELVVVEVSVALPN